MQKIQLSWQRKSRRSTRRCWKHCFLCRKNIKMCFIYITMKVIRRLRSAGFFDIIIESEAMSSYLTNEAELVFSVAADNNNKENQLRNGIAGGAGCMKHGGQSLGVDIDIVTAAHENGLSMGKYSAYLQLVQYDDTVTVDDCQQMTMSEIHGLINHHKQYDMNPDAGGSGGDNASEAHGSHYRQGNHENHK